MGQSLYFRMRQSSCGDETGNGGLYEWGADDMKLTGFVVNPKGSLHKLPVWNVGQFNDGEEIDYTKGQSPTTGKALYSWDLGEYDSEEWPLTFSIVLIPIEADEEGSLRSRRELRDKAMEEVADLLDEKFDEASEGEGASSFGDWFDEVVVDAIEDLLRGLWSGFLDAMGFKDDAFAPQMRSVTLSGPTHTFKHADGERYTFTESPRWIFGMITTRRTASTTIGKLGRSLYPCIDASLLQTQNRVFVAPDLKNRAGSHLDWFYERPKNRSKRRARPGSP